MGNRGYNYSGKNPFKGEIVYHHPSVATFDATGRYIKNISVRTGVPYVKDKQGKISSKSAEFHKYMEDIKRGVRNS